MLRYHNVLIDHDKLSLSLRCCRQAPIDKLVHMYSLTRVLIYTIIMNKDIRIGIIHGTGDCPFKVMFLTCLYCLILFCVFFQCMLYLVVFYFGDFRL